MEQASRNYTSASNDYVLNSPSKDHISSPPKKKHSMILNLGNKSSSGFGADQTPTPTRFIRNCEEVGLFQDLQNVNPFEETFRKAVESGKTGSMALQNSRLSANAVVDDTLHTPHVFPHIMENESAGRLDIHHDRSGVDDEKRRAVGVCREGAVSVKVVRQEADTSQLQLRPLRPVEPRRSVAVAGPESVGSGSLSSLSQPQSQPVQLILQMPDGRLMQLNATPLDSDKKTDLQGPVDLVARVDKTKSEMASVILHTSPNKKPESDNISPLIKEKLKARLVNAAVDKAPANIDLRTGRAGQKEESRAKRSSSTSNASNSEDDEETKRRRFLERNRAAAMRCREKRKCWVAALEHRAELMLSTNQQLQLEVSALRSEVATLKTLLLAHKDCPVTRAMCNNQIVPGSMVFPVEVDSLVVKPPLHVTPVHIVKPLSAEETAFRQNLRKKLRTVSVRKSISQEIESVREEIPKKKRLSLDIETAKQSQCLSEKDSPLVRSDEYLSSTLLPNEPLELEGFSKPVATQVIQVNPNVLYRDRTASPPPPLPLLPISPAPSPSPYS